MEYLSTRDKTLRKRAAEAITMGLSRDGGLFTPERFPSLSILEVEALCGMPYYRGAAYIMSKFLEDFRPEDLERYAEEAYGGGKFDDPQVAPMRQLNEKTWCLELWHGPTSAFKDMALQMLPRLLTASLKMTGEEKTACILVATSGDTGKAAMEGFADVDQVKILTFYPENGVSEIQKLQMVTQEGQNVGVCAVKGNFDDAQNGVKRIFSDPAFRGERLPVLRQLHQLGAHPAPGGVLCVRLLRPAQRQSHPAGRPGELLRAHREFWKYPGLLLRQADGTACGQTDLRLQPQRCTDGFHPYRHL